MAHNRKLVLGGVALTLGRGNRYEISVMTEVRDELEALIISCGYLDNAPFKWVGLILRYGLKNEDEPHYQRVNKKYGDLPVAIELDTHELRHASREELKEIFMLATLKVLVHVGQRYGLPSEPFVEMLQARQTAQPKHPTPDATEN
jgi:hypothetical protein